MKKPRLRSMFTRRIEMGDEKPPVRNYKARAATADREEWHVEYDRVGKNVVGTLFKDNEVVRKTFIVKLEKNQFHVDIGTGSGVKIRFEHGPKPEPKFHLCTCGIMQGTCTC